LTRTLVGAVVACAGVVRCEAVVARGEGQSAQLAKLMPGRISSPTSFFRGERRMPSASPPLRPCQPHLGVDHTHLPIWRLVQTEGQARYESDAPMPGERILIGNIGGAYSRLLRTLAA
jgi:hypothetical protein